MPVQSTGRGAIVCTAGQSKLPIKMARFDSQFAESMAARLAERVGVPSGDAVIFAHALVHADLNGTSTHGLSRLHIYLQPISKGLIIANAELRIDRDGGSLLAIDAGNGLGQVQATKSLEILMPLARRN